MLRSARTPVSDAPRSAFKATKNFGTRRRSDPYASGVYRAIVFDGDDTLWETEALYDDARQRAREVVEDSGLDGERWEALERRIDVANVERFGHGAERFPTSCVEAYDRLSALNGEPVDARIREAVRAAARGVFERPAPLVAHARQTLDALRDLGFRLGLLTKGDAEVQRLRVEQSGLADLFDVIEIVDTKTPEAIGSVVDRLGTPLQGALSVGNSMRSDVLPSLAAGVRPVWIDAHVWEYEREHPAAEDDQVIHLDRLDQLLEVVAR